MRQNTIKPTDTADSVGIVAPQSLKVDQSLKLDCGKTLPGYELRYETYGQLNKAASNALLVCHALSGDHHAAGKYQDADAKPGWWDSAIGPGKPIDTNRFFVVSSNNLGGCGGSTGPTSINPETGKPYGPDFPVVTVKDWVRSQKVLGESLGIKQWAAIVGGSLGAMQAMQWSIDYPDALRHAVIIAAAPRLSAQNIAFNEIARQAILNDPDFHAGRYAEHDAIPRQGLAQARMLGHITYLSDDAMRAKFGRELREGKLGFNYDVEFEVESYLRYQGRSFVERFDANTYLLMTKALDYFDPAADFNDDLAAALRGTKASYLVISFSNDWRFSPTRSREIVEALVQADRPVTYAELRGQLGHDDFLLTQPDYIATLGNYLRRVSKETQPGSIS